MANKRMKRYSASLVFMKMQIKITVRYHFEPSRLTIVKKTVTSAGKDVEKLEPTHIAERNVNGVAAVENVFSVPQIVKESYHLTQQIYTVLSTKIYRNVHSTIIPNRQNVETSQTSTI